MKSKTRGLASITRFDRGSTSTDADPAARGLFGALGTRKRRGATATGREVPMASELTVDLDDLPGATLEARIAKAAELGFHSVELSSDTLYGSYGIDRSGLTPGLAAHLSQVLGSQGVTIAVLHCQGNLALTEGEGLDGQLAEYGALIAFGARIGARIIGTGTGYPNPQAVVDDRRLLRAAQDRFCAGLEKVLGICGGHGMVLAMEPDFTQCICSTLRCREVLDRFPGSGLGVIWNPVGLLHPAVMDRASEVVQGFMELCGERVVALRTAEGVEDPYGVLRWARESAPRIPVITEYGRPDGFRGYGVYGEAMGVR